MTAPPGVTPTTEVAAGLQAGRGTDPATSLIGAAAQLIDAAVRGGGGCLIPPVTLHATGYAFASSQGRQIGVHRAAKAISLGVSLEEMSSWCDAKGRPLVVDHLCRNRACCEQSHLDLVENKVNILRGKSWSAENAAKEHCSRGHELAGANVRHRSTGGRRCVTCQRERDATRDRRKRVA